MLLAAIALFLGQAPGEPAPAPGKWQGDLYGKPAVVLTLKEEGGRYSGTIVFTFFLKKGDRWEPSGETALPLLDPRLDGKVLTFQVAHRDSRDNNKPAPMRVEFTGRYEALLYNLRHPDMAPSKLRRLTDR